MGREDGATTGIRTGRRSQWTPSPVLQGVAKLAEFGTLGEMEISWTWALNLVGIAVGLAMDAFAVSISAGMMLAPVTPRHIFRLAFHFGLFQCLMPILGWMVGQQITGHLYRFNAWVAFALLAYVGGKMLWEAWQGDEAESRADPTRGMTLVMLSVATSIDALAVGLSMALLGVSVWMPAVVIGIVTGALTTVGITFGSRVGKRCGRWAEVAGGCVLMLIGLRVLITS